MSTYKVIQDIEAEDKILGPLTLRQFIFGLSAALMYYLSFIVLTKHAAFLLVVFLPPALFATFFAIPFGGDQPTEIWALAKIRFMFKPRRRIWDQGGIKELVTVTAPKKVEEMRTDGLSQGEIRSRLSALANTIDSRGWAVKNVNLNLSAQPQVIANDPDSDRLIGVDNLPQDVPTTDIQAADDIMDEQNNPIAHQFDQMIAASTQAHRQQIMSMMSNSTNSTSASNNNSTTAPADYWFLSQPVVPPKLEPNQAMFGTTSVAPSSTGGAQSGVIQAADPTAEEEAIAEHVRAEHAKPSAAYAHLKTIQPLGTQASDTTGAAPANIAQSAVPTPVTAQPNPAILELANNNDLSVATLARQANKKGPESPDEGEVVIALR